MSHVWHADVIIIGAGIIGAACAYQLIQDGLTVILIDDQQKGATHAGMGHLVLLDDNLDELTLSYYSLQQWRTITPRLPIECAWQQCGTIWVADVAEELLSAEVKQQRLAKIGVSSQLLTAQQLAATEPMLREGIAGGLRVPEDSILYPPNVVSWFIRDHHRLIKIYTRVIALDQSSVILEDGKRLAAANIVLANGLGSTQLLPDLPLFAKKGLLAITDRYPICIRHQLVELSYTTSVQSVSDTSVAFNVQARPTGQLLIGSSRQFNSADDSIDLSLLQQMLQRALYFLPRLGGMNVIRCWSGLRIATPDGLPILGQHPDYSWLWLAVGHEGLGVTTAPGSAKLLAALITGRGCEIDPAPYTLARFVSQSALQPVLFN